MIGGGYIAKQVNCQRQNVVKSTVRNSSKYSPIPYLDLHIQSVTILCCATSQFHRLRSNVECRVLVRRVRPLSRAAVDWCGWQRQCCVSVMFHVQRTESYLDIYRYLALAAPPGFNQDSYAAHLSQPSHIQYHRKKRLKTQTNTIYIMQMENIIR